MNKITLPIPILVLQHPQEPSRKDHAVSSARLLDENLFPCSVRVGLSWRNLEAALKGFDAISEIPELKKPSSWATLYLGTKKHSQSTSGSNGNPASSKASGTQLAGTSAGAGANPKTASAIAMPPGLYFLNKKGEPIDPPRGEEQNPICGLILLDGTWAQAKTMWWRNPWLLKTRRMHLIPKQKSLYGNLRKEPRPECVSTLEAAAETLSFMGVDESVETQLKAAFSEALKAYRASRGSSSQRSSKP